MMEKYGVVREDLTPPEREKATTPDELADHVAVRVEQAVKKEAEAREQK